MDTNRLKAGQLVEITDFEGRKLVRKAVEIADGIVYICTPAEFDLALKKGKEPIVIGFEAEFVEPCHGNSASHSEVFVSSE